MIKLESFLKIDNIYINIQNFTGNIVDPYYIAGAIILTINEHEILTLKMWDYVDQLWSYIAEGVKDVIAGEAFETFFPDQPTKLSFEPIGKFKVRVSVEYGETRRSAVVERAEFISTFIEEGIRFFSAMERLQPAEGVLFRQIIEEFNLARLNEGQTQN